MGKPSSTSRRESGQAAVESALTLPLTIFLILGILQLFMVLQARIMAEYGIYQAVRAGSLNNGDCQPMMHAAILAFLPTITKTDTPGAVAAAFTNKRAQDKYDVKDDGGKLNSSIVWMERLSPKSTDFRGPEDDAFDRPTATPRTLQVRAIFWYHLKIPFADWVISRMVLAHMGIKTYAYQNPLLETQKARWTADAEGVATIGALNGMRWPADSVTKTKKPRTEMRKLANAKHYVLPIEVSAAMRMMTPAKKWLLIRKCPGFAGK